MVCKRCSHLESDHGSGGVCFKEVKQYSDQRIPIGCDCASYKK